MSKILVVDDDEGILDVMTLMLETAGYIVQTSTKQAEIYQKITEFKPDLILLDVLMSGLDGRIICKKLKTDPKYNKIPIIMVSAHPSAAKGAVENKADSFIAKPFEINEMLSLIQKHIKN